MSTRFPNNPVLTPSHSGTNLAPMLITPGGLPLVGDPLFESARKDSRWHEVLTRLRFDSDRPRQPHLGARLISRHLATDVTGE